MDEEFIATLTKDEEDARLAIISQWQFLILICR